MQTKLQALRDYDDELKAKIERYIESQVKMVSMDILEGISRDIHNITETARVSHEQDYQERMKIKIEKKTSTINSKKD